MRGAAPPLDVVALALAGRDGVRLACLLGVVVGRRAKLRLILGMLDPVAGRVGARG